MLGDLIHPSMLLPLTRLTAYSALCLFSWQLFYYYCTYSQAFLGLDELLGIVLKTQNSLGSDL